MKKKPWWPYLVSLVVSIFGIFNSMYQDKKMKEMIEETTRETVYDEFNRLAREKHGGPRHRGPYKNYK